ncbi:MAG: hypothetical protein LBE80_06850 [Deltaproteobacteria bacterium]|jgi:hypothetical protein|nr:hypothetical protein [Deltaproteobacteria bacterium]
MTLAKTLKDVKAGGEVELLCPKCQRKTSHKIVSTQGGQPKQVICQACEHKYAHKPGDLETLPAEAVREESPAKVSDGAAGATKAGAKAGTKGASSAKGAVKPKAVSKAADQDFEDHSKPEQGFDDYLDQDSDEDFEDNLDKILEDDLEDDFNRDLDVFRDDLEPVDKKSSAKVGAKASAKTSKAKVAASKSPKVTGAKVTKHAIDKIEDEPDEVEKPKVASKSRAKSASETRLAREDRELKEAKKQALEEIEVNKDLWNSLKSRLANASPVDYTLSGDYVQDQVLRHKKFGLGFVTKVLLPNKIEVQFEEFIKTLVMRVTNV